jgi:hypothetical protein
MSDTAVITPPDTDHQVSTGDGDHDRFAHYVPKDRIVESAVTGRPVTALCGKRWVPNRAPDGYPVCPSCKSIRDRLPEHEK